MPLTVAIFLALPKGKKEVTKSVGFETQDLDLCFLCPISFAPQATGVSLQKNTQIAAAAYFFWSQVAYLEAFQGCLLISPFTRRVFLHPVIPPEIAQNSQASGGHCPD